MSETYKIYIWPDNSWELPEFIPDMDEYLANTGKSDDYLVSEVPGGLDEEDIEELILLKALPGMLPEKTTKLEDLGEIPIPEGAVIMITHSKDIDYSPITVLEDRVIVSAPKMVLKVMVNKGEE